MNVVLFKGVSFFLMGFWVFGLIVYCVFFVGVLIVEIMGGVGFFVFFINLVSVLFLVCYKDGDVNVWLVWLCLCNDVIGNVVVMFVVLGVWGMVIGWFDFVVVMIMVGLFLLFVF